VRFDSCTANPQEVHAMNQQDLERLVSFRMTELEAREELIDNLKEVFAKKLWRDLGHLSFARFCEEELGFERNEIRETLIRLDAIVTTDMLVSKDKPTQVRIDKLKTWRRTRASQRGIAAYRVISNSTLLDIAKARPQTVADLEQVKGIGPSKLKEFGAEILSLVD
jgi:ribonuclease D